MTISGLAVLLMRYSYRMDTNQDVRIERYTAILKPELKKTSRGAYWLGFAIGLLLGLAVGALV